MSVQSAVTNFNQRLGRFTVSRKLLYKSPQDALEVFKGMLVIETTYHIESDRIEYLAMCELFSVVEPGFLIPIYLIHVEKNLNGTQVTANHADQGRYNNVLHTLGDGNHLF